MTLRQLKLEFFYIRKAFIQYRRGFKYIYLRFYLAKRILKRKQSIDQPVNRPDVSMHILTCHRDMVLFLWSVKSLYQTWSQIGQLYIHDDGSLLNSDLDILNRLLPLARIVKTETFLSEHKNQIENFPTVLSYRSSYKNFSFKKIIDPYFTSDTQYRVILDSDILWFKEPVEINEVLSKENAAVMQLNNGLTPASKQGGDQFDKRYRKYNAGIIVYHRDAFNMSRFEDYLSMLDSNESKNLHFADQIGHAYSLDNLVGLPEERYTIKGEVSEHTVAKHYTSPRRPLFYFDAK